MNLRSTLTLVGALPALALGLTAMSARRPVDGPVADARLVLWLDAQDPLAGAPAPPEGTLLERWADRSGQANHALQPDPVRRPALAAGPGARMRTVRFDASRGQFLSAGTAASLDLRRFTAFVVARANPGAGNMWLIGKNHWGPPWTGFGLAVTADGLHPWPHLGLGSHGAERGVQLRHAGSLGGDPGILEVSYDGRRGSIALNGAPDRGVAIRADLLPNDRPLFIGAGPQFLPAAECLSGDIAEVLLYREALTLDERARVRRYLSARYSIPLAESPDSGAGDDRIPLSAEDATPETRTLPPAQAAAMLEADWLYQAEGRPLGDRSLAEIEWARAIAARRPAGPGVTADLAQLAALERRLRAEGGWPDPAAARRLYLAVRQVKRRLMLRSPALGFRSLLFVDQPYPQGSEWPHEALHHLGKMAAPGGRLLVLEGLSPGAPVRRLMPDRVGALLRPDVSWDGARVLVSFKPANEQTYHLYEARADGSAVRQITRGRYDDISPTWAPDGSILFCTSRCNSYVRCGPYIESAVLARCDPHGRRIYIISANNEPDYTPAILPDGRVLYTRWEYTDKEQIRVQSLWTANPDGTGVAAYWGNQSIWPDILFEARPIPGDGRMIFSGVGHHDIFSGSIGIVDRSAGLNYPAGLSKVTRETPWGEVGDGPRERPERADYHTAGAFSSYRSPYPLGDSLFLVSARRRDSAGFQLYLMDMHGNRELIYTGAYNILHAMPLRASRRPPVIPDRVAWPGPESAGRTVAPGVLFSGDVYAGMPEVPRGAAKFLRVIQQDSSTFSLGRKSQQPGDTVTQPIMLGGPPISLTVVDGIKRVLGTVPIEPDGSVCLQVPPSRALHFQLLDARGRAIQTMRSFANLMPGERRGCTGCHEMHSAAPAAATAMAVRRPPRRLTPPPFGAAYTFGYERSIQPILNRYCGACHQGNGAGRSKLDLTLRPGAGIFKEPYVTLVLGRLPNPTSFDWPPVGCGGIAGTLIPAAMPPATMLRTVPPMTALSYRSPLIALASTGQHHGVRLDPDSLARLIAWVDLLCPYRGEPEVRAMADPDPAPFAAMHWPIVPRMATAPVVRREYQQDEFDSQEARLPHEHPAHPRQRP